MGKKKIVGLMGVAIVVLAVVGINSKRELAEARAALEQLEAEPATGDRQTEELLAQSPEAQTEPAETVASIAPTAETPTEEPPSADSEDPEPAGRRLMRSLSRMMDNPAMNKMMVASQRAALDVMYADLADQFQLNGDEREHFMELLLTRQMNMMDVAMKMMTGNLSKEDQDALSAELKEKNDLLKEEMEYFLNSADDVAEWEFYEKTLQDRMMLSQVEQALGCVGQPA